MNDQIAPQFKNYFCQEQNEQTTSRYITLPGQCATSNMSSSVPFISAEHTSCNKDEAESTSKDLPTVSAEASTSSAKANHSDGSGAGAVLDNSNNNNDEMGKRKTRLEQNRISARESRKRKKVMIEELQRSVQLLNNENRLLNQQNQLLRHQLIQLQVRRRFM